MLGTRDEFCICIISNKCYLIDRPMISVVFVVAAVVGGDDGACSFFSASPQSDFSPLSHELIIKCSALLSLFSLYLLLLCGVQTHTVGLRLVLHV